MLRDETGEDFVDAAAAREAAVRGISELIAEQIAAGERVDLRHRIEIVDGDGLLITAIRFGELFEGRGPPEFTA